MKYLRQRPAGEGYLRWFPPSIFAMERVIKMQKRAELFYDEDEV
jgi:hypothetical protein